jgi:stearoyl-CoA desaturase (Delta-9 desaturase)
MTENGTTRTDRPTGQGDHTWRVMIRRVRVSMLVTASGLISLATLIVCERLDFRGLAIFGLFFALTAVGIEVGYHRMLSHRAFIARPRVQAILAILGAMAMQGPIYFWVTTHRRHHRFADLRNDPHSPPNAMGTLRRLWHLHVAWHFERTSLPVNSYDHVRYSRDLIRDPNLRMLDARYTRWVAAGFVIPALLGAAAYGTWSGAALGFLWGGPIRIFAVNQVVWATNSIGHTFGKRPYKSGDQSTNVWWLAVLNFGGAWHNGHHAFPGSARCGFGTLEPDASWTIIRTLNMLGWVHDVNVPDETALLARRRSPN